MGTPISHQAAQDVQEYREEWAVKTWPYVVGTAVLVGVLIFVACLLFGVIL